MENEEETFESLKRRYNQLVKDVDEIVKDRQKILDRNTFLEESLINAQRALDIQKQVNNNSITDMNKAKSQFAEDLQRLQAEKRKLQEEIRKLKDGS